MGAPPITSSKRSTNNKEKMVQSPLMPSHNSTKESIQEEQHSNNEDVILHEQIPKPTVSFHNCFHVHHNQSKTMKREKNTNNTSSGSTPQMLSKSIHDDDTEPKKKLNRKINSSSILIGDVEDASDDEYDELDSIWNRRRPSEGQWMEPVLFEMTM